MRYVLLSFVFLFFACDNQPPMRVDQALIKSDTQSAMLDFAIAKLNGSLQASHLTIAPINLHLAPERLQEQAFQITSTPELIDITAGDVHGLMYGLLELEEHIALQLDVTELSISQMPFIKKRGLKFNIPLDARTPSYDDTGDAAQSNIANVWDFNFWQQQLDQMALHRFNQLTLWNPQPFTSMLKLEAFPGLALADVYRSSEPLSEKWTSWGEPGGVSANVLSKLERVKEISIDEKILFWKKVFAYAKDRGIDVHLITWSIYPNGIDPKHGITSDIDNEKTQAFFREAVKELVLTYPNLKGVGVTAGENMPVDGTVKNWTREKWLWETYGRGLAEAKAIHPDRSIDFMHRFWYSGYEDIEKYWSDYPDH
ncbi:MAG: carbohydrate-binding family 6 protein, partial [Rhodothermales bacterium]